MKRLFPLLLLLLCTGALARPAWWYWYESRIDGQRVCSQTPLGEGWKKVAGPYRDAHCEKLARPQ